MTTLDEIRAQAQAGKLKPTGTATHAAPAPVLSGGITDQKLTALYDKGAAKVTGAGSHAMGLRVVYNSGAQGIQN